MKKVNRAALISEVLAVLKANGEPFQLLDSSGESELRYSNWMESSFPIASWGRIAWDNVPNSRCWDWEDFDQLLNAFNEMCNSVGEKNPVVAVFWSNQLKPTLKLSFTTVKRYAEQIFEADWDTWIVCLDENWCIENYHEGELCFGYVPSVSQLE